MAIYIFSTKVKPEDSSSIIYRLSTLSCLLMTVRLGEVFTDDITTQGFWSDIIWPYIFCKNPEIITS